MGAITMLYMFRTSQADTLMDATKDGALRYVGSFDERTSTDKICMGLIKKVITLTAEMMDANETIAFAEVTKLDHDNRGDR